jgi:hypothetical protein
MPHPDGAHTHGHGHGSSGGSGLVVAALILLALAFAGPTLAAALNALLVAAVILGGLALAGGTVLVYCRVRRSLAAGDRPVALPPPAPWRPVQAPTEPRALDGPAELHLHLHGVNAQDIAAILRRDMPD